MVQDQTAAAVVVGGYVGSSSAIYRLPNAGSSSWTKMSQTLQTGRYWHVAFLVPDSVANCAVTATVSQTIVNVQQVSCQSGFSQLLSCGLNNLPTGK